MRDAAPVAHRWLGSARRATSLERSSRDRMACGVQDAKEILFLAEIPRGATGKLQLIGLAPKLSLGRAAAK
jgi:hypothetical protein